MALPRGPPHTHRNPTGRLYSYGIINGADAMDEVVGGMDALGINHVLVQIYANYTGGQKLPDLEVHLLRLSLLLLIRDSHVPLPPPP